VRVVVAVVVVVEPGLRIAVLAGETPRRRRTAVVLDDRFPPERGAVAPREVAGAVQQLRRRADAVGDHRVEVAADPLLRGGQPAPDLGEGPEPARMPFPCRRVDAREYLLGESHAVPDELGAFHDGGAVGCELVLGDTPAEGVVEVAPAGTVRRADLHQAILGVPGVVPPERCPARLVPTLVTTRPCRS